MKRSSVGLRVEMLEDRNTPSCSWSNFYGEIASSSPPGAIGSENSGGAHVFIDSGDPAGWGEVNMVFGQIHGC